MAGLGSTLAGSLFAGPVTAALAAETPAADKGTPFSRSTVTGMARDLAQKPFAPPSQDLPDAIKNLTYDQYRALYFRPEKAIWAGEKLPFTLQMFHRGFYYKDRIDIAVVDNGVAHHIAYSPDMYAPGAIVKNPLPKEDIGFSGLRIHGYINTPDRLDEIAVFQGASYFRSLGKGQVYGLSARGLALNVGQPQGEEFPIFRAFWVEKPSTDSDQIVVHALLDSKSVAGAYRFTIRPGMPTEMDVETTLFPRVDLTTVGLAPGTSMYYFSGNGRTGFDDWRPEVHDSDGLAILNGRGERIWRPLANPKTLQFSSFVDTGVRGFGLMQRTRNYDAYDDYDAHYELRPSLWVEPVGDWGKGAVVLIEIPSDSEVNDNIVAYWQPSEPIAAHSDYSFAYRLSWGDGPAKPGVVVISTRSGRGDLLHPSPVRRFIVDYADTGIPLPAAPKPAPAPAQAAPGQAAPAGAAAPAADPPPALPKAAVTTSGGEISDILIQVNPETKGWRLAFNLDPKDKKLIELRATLTFADGRPVDTWLYRWTA
jgi:glucans biosynthesis protein